MTIKTIPIVCILSIFLLGCSNDSEKAQTKFIQANAQLQASVDSLSAQLDSVNQLIPAIQASSTKGDLLNDEDLAFLKRKGLAKPLEDIKSDLAKNSKLIPIKGSLGGTMQFYKEKIYILNSKWVLAYFEDGHNAGEMLLEYQVNDTGNISWKVITTGML